MSHNEWRRALQLRSGVDVNAGDGGALRAAASAGAVAVVAALLAAPWRADVHAGDDEALLWAADNGHEVGGLGGCRRGQGGAYCIAGVCCVCVCV
jgi:hypothetical protein